MVVRFLRNGVCFESDEIVFSERQGFSGEGLKSCWMSEHSQRLGLIISNADILFWLASVLSQCFIFVKLITYFEIEFLKLSCVLCVNWCYFFCL